MGEVKAAHSGLGGAASWLLGGQTEACPVGGPSVYSHGCTPL